MQGKVTRKARVFMYKLRHDISTFIVSQSERYFFFQGKIFITNRADVLFFSHALQKCVFSNYQLVQIFHHNFDTAVVFFLHVLQKYVSLNYFFALNLNHSFGTWKVSFFHEQQKYAYLNHLLQKNLYHNCGTWEVSSLHAGIHLLRISKLRPNILTGLQKQTQ